MSDVVFDTTVVSIGNKNIVDRKTGSSFDKILHLLQKVVDRVLYVRYNDKLRKEFEEHVKTYRNDTIEIFFSILDSSQAIRVKKNNLSRQHFDLAVCKARWPNHDQHLIAAAINGKKPYIYVTEQRLERCAGEVYRVLRIRVIKI